MRTLPFDSSKPHQTIDNFGASACWWTDPAYESFSPEHMNEMARLLFDRETGAGLSCIRFNLGGGSSWYDTEYIENWMMRSACFQHGPEAPYDWSQHAGQQWLLKKAREYGVERSIAFVNSPPAWLTVNGHTRGDERTGTTNLKFGNEAAFGRFLADVLKHFEEIGLPFDYISPINEPQVPWDEPKQEGCRYSNEDTIRTILAVKRELDQAGVSAKMLVNESNCIFSLMDIDTIMPYLSSFPGMSPERGWQYGGKYCEQVKDIYNLSFIREAVAPIISAHSYESDAPGVLSGSRRILTGTLERYPGYDYWMTEYCILGPYGPKRDLGMDTGLYIARIIHADLTLLNAAAWQWWLGISGADYKDGLVYIDLDEQGHAGKVYSSKMLMALGHYARFLRPGSVRVELDNTDFEEGLLASGWLDAGGKPVVVLVNTGTADESVQIEHAQTGAWKVWRTSETEDLKCLGTISANAPLTMTGRSMVTLTAE